MATQAQYRQFFAEADTDKSGFLTVTELVNILKKKGYSGDESKIRTMFKATDRSGDDKISFEEYMAVMGQQPEKNHKEAATRSAFRQFDRDNSGTIDRNELNAVFKELGKNLSEQEINRIIALADKDKSGTLNYEEFIKEVYG